MDDMGTKDIIEAVEAEMSRGIKNDLTELYQYAYDQGVEMGKDIGVEEYQNHMRAIKIKYVKDDDWECPNCYTVWSYIGTKCYRYCPECGIGLEFEEIPSAEAKKEWRAEQMIDRMRDGDV